MNFKIRLYQPRDEREVRRICFETALYGKPIETVFDDETFISEAWLSYYWRFEPELFWVAADDERVLGYLTGCADTALFQRRYLWRIVPVLARQFLIRRLWRKPLAGILLRQWRTLLAYGFSSSHGLLRDFPAHGHVNVAAHARGQGVGRALLKTFLDALKAKKIRGVHAATATPGGARLFKQAGFSSRRSLPAIRLTEESPAFVEILAKNIRVPESF